MAAPSCNALGLWVRGSGQCLGSRFILACQPFCSSAAASGTLNAQKLAEKLRSQKQEQKTKTQPVPTNPVQRRVQELVRFTQQLQRVHPNVLAKALSRGIVHQDKDLVVINKPYGLPVHGGPGVQLCISDVLPILAKMLRGHKAEPLHLCHRLDKETTGVMVLAWEKEMAHQVQELFRTRQVVKKYWAIAVRVPVPSAGVVDIPIVEKEVQGPQQHYKMTLSPGYRMDNGKMVRARTSRNAHVAVTQYQVLSSTLSSALLELQPITGIKHQLRVHLSFGLDCPILGDHKYSDWNKLAPQKLSVGTLKKLGLKQAKARHIPLHLHARQLVLPALGSRKEELNLVCKPPRYFLCSLRRLDLRMPSQDQSGDDEAGRLRAQ
ncbi:mitochondrial RNA pseudouridine synthase RPUSD4 [Panthera tigris]|uniref:Pseudouridylate synthase RPUSD4, mitochondrial n=1 Tax=Panthera tigris altaica TaxID=74533 RepID=A0A8C9JYE4_PANTA|nr:mitochondrial RNA pseudouridine synthase RPUSD4 [Panthera tigris]XP_049510645.1 pseudouridylate synthase RPUSD4, mitochondrial [Panthera uncia]XP_060461170.1 pseudouridylate synthase RPUSD4, mitochondrial isoform X1 [Panthera onca]